MPETPPTEPLGNGVWDALVAPASAVTDPGERRRLRVLAGIAWPLLGFAVLEVLTAPETGRVVGLMVVALIALSYALARSTWPLLAPYLLIAASGVVPYYGLLTPEPTTRPLAELSWALLLPMVASFVLPARLVLPIGWSHVIALGAITLSNEGIPKTGAWQLIATSSIVTLFAIVASWNREAQDEVLEERDQHLTSALDDLAQTRALSESTIASMADGLLVADGTRRIRAANPALCNALGYEEAELLGQPLEFVLVDDNADTQIFEAPLSGGDSLLSKQAIEAGFRTRGGDELPMSCKVTWLQAPGELEFGLVVLARDMRAVVRTIEAKAEAEAHRRKATEIKQAHDQLLQTQAQLVQAGKLAALGELAGAVAHEVNNPLAAALLAADLAEEALEEDESELAKSQIGVIHEAIARCRNVINGLLDFGRQSSGTREQVDLTHVVESAMSLIARKLEASGSTVIVDISEPLPVWGDRNQLGQVVLNLLMNASQASADQATVHVRGSRSLGEVRLSVKDSGSGIPPDVLRKIFEPFFTTKPRGKGTGLGLSISYGIVADHEGRIDVQSEVGRGSTFTVVLPDADAVLNG